MNSYLCFLFKYIYRSASHSVLKDYYYVLFNVYIYIYSRGISFLLEKNRHTSDLLKLCCTMVREECSGNLMRKLWEHVLIFISE